MIIRCWYGSVRLSNVRLLKLFMWYLLAILKLQKFKCWFFLAGFFIVKRFPSCWLKQVFSPLSSTAGICFEPSFCSAFFEVRIACRCFFKYLTKAFQGETFMWEFENQHMSSQNILHVFLNALYVFFLMRLLRLK